MTYQNGDPSWVKTGDAAMGHIKDSVIKDYQMNGVVVSGPGVSVTVSGNEVTGAGSVDYIAQNGIQVSRGATATVNKNTVKDNWYADSPDETTACGLLFYKAGGVSSASKTSSEASSRTSATTGSAEEASSVSDPSIRHPLSKERAARAALSAQGQSRKRAVLAKGHAGGRRDDSVYPIWYANGRRDSADVGKGPGTHYAGWRGITLAMRASQGVVGGPPYPICPSGTV